MSAESDLLFPHTDALVFSDFHLSEFEELAKDLILESAISGHLMEDQELDGKDDLTPQEISDLKTFTALDEDEEINSSCLLSRLESKDEDSSTMSAHGFSESSMIMAFDATDCKSEFGAEFDVLRNVRLGLTGKVGASVFHLDSDQAETLSPSTRIATCKLNRMSLSEALSESFDEILPVSPLTTPGSAASDEFIPARSSSCSPSVLFNAVAPSSLLDSPVRQVPKTQGFPPSSVSVSTSVAGHIGSLVSSPASAISTSDGSCSDGNATIPGQLKNLFNGVNGFNIQHGNGSLQSAESTFLSDRSGLFGSHTPQVGPSASCRGAIPPRVIRESSHLPTIQRSYSSHALGQLKSLAHPHPTYTDFQPLPVPSLEAPTTRLETLSPYNQAQTSADSQGVNVRPTVASIRRVYSTGDLQMQIYNGNMEEGILKIGQYTLEERRMRLNRYRQKRMERNFSKKIKYACRKTLADSRPRIRGRFARTDDIEEPVIIKANGTPHDEHDAEAGTTLEAEDKFLISDGYSSANYFWDVLGMQPPYISNSTAFI